MMGEQYKRNIALICGQQTQLLHTPLSNIFLTELAKTADNKRKHQIKDSSQVIAIIAY